MSSAEEERAKVTSTYNRVVLECEHASKDVENDPLENILDAVVLRASRWILANAIVCFLAVMLEERKSCADSFSLFS